MNFHLCWKAFSPRPLGARLNLDLHFTRGATAFEVILHWLFILLDDSDMKKQWFRREGAGNLFDIQCDSLSMKNNSEWCDLRNTLCPQPFPPQKVSSDAMPALQQVSETSNRTCIKGHWTRENTLFLKACKCKTFQILDLTQHNNYYCKVSPNK